MGPSAAGPALASTAVKAAPLLLVAVGICIAFRANMFNIGGEGQIATAGWRAPGRARVPGLPSLVLIPLVLLAGAVGGAAWAQFGRLQGLLPGQRDPEHHHPQPRRRAADEHLLGGPSSTGAGDAAGSSPRPRSSLPTPGCRSSSAARGPPRRAHRPAGRGGAYVILWRTGLGYGFRAVGLSVEAAQYAGCPSSGR